MTPSPTAQPAGTRRLAVLLLLAVLAACVSVLGTHGTAHAEDTTAADAAAQLAAIRAIPPDRYERRINHFVNVRRARHDLPPVKVGRCVDRYAEKWGSHLAADLAFYHQTLDKFFSKCDALYAGETLARGAVSPRAMVRMWMNSPEHKHILLSTYPNRIGVGAYQDSRGDWVVAADFIKR